MNFTSDYMAEPLDRVVAALLKRAGLLEGDDFSVAGLSGSYSMGVNALAITNLSSARTIVDLLAAAYYFESSLSDMIRFNFRGRPAVDTIPYHKLGVSDIGAKDNDPFPLTVGSGLEQNSFISVTYANLLDDQQTDTQSAWAMEDSQNSSKVVQFAMGLYPSDAKQIAEVLTRDQNVAMLSASIKVGLEYAHLEPTDVINIVDKDGSIYRMRITTRMDSGSIIQFDCVHDDQRVFNTSGSGTSGDYDPESQLIKVCNSIIVPLDLPLLRDVDDAPGVYLACGVDTGMYDAPYGQWNAAAIYDTGEHDEWGYPLNFALNGPAPGKVCVAVLSSSAADLNAYTGPADTLVEASIHLYIQNGATYPTGVTFSRLALSDSINMVHLGGEIIRFRDAIMVSTYEYVLSGIVRGVKGTHDKMYGHTDYEAVTFLDGSGTKFSKLQNSFLGTTRTYKAVTVGASYDSASNATVTVGGENLRPYAPCNFFNTPNHATGDLSCSWSRRTRMSSRWMGTIGWIIPVGEDTESYEVDVFSDATYTTVLEVFTVTTPSFTMTAAEQTTLFGSPQSNIYLRVYQMSARVGRGHSLQGHMRFN